MYRKLVVPVARNDCYDEILSVEIICSKYVIANRKYDKIVLVKVVDCTVFGLGNRSHRY